MILFEQAVQVAESPAEARVFEAFQRAGGWFEIYHRGVVGKTADGIYLIPQLQVGRYRADFWLSFGDLGCTRSVFIEVDGHEFHERTPAQAARDKARDRFLSARMDCPVFRFTGSEIYRDVDACLAEAISAVRS